jgi:hypothetical protein
MQDISANEPAQNVITNSSWSGWMLFAPPGLAGTFGGVSADFETPLDSIPGQTSPICPGVIAAHASHWVGIDGLNGVTGGQNVNVIQDGIDNYLACSGAGAVGFEVLTPWVEFYPRDPFSIDVRFSQGKVSIGDNISLSVYVIPTAGIPNANLFITDMQLNATIAPQTSLNSTFNPNEAEVVNEAPGGSPQGGLWLMPDFGKVIYSDASAYTPLPALTQLPLGANVTNADGAVMLQTAGLDFNVKGIDGGVHVVNNKSNVGSHYKFK